MLWFIIDKEIFELKLSDVCLQSIPIKYNYFLMLVSFSSKSEDHYPVEVGWLNPYDELHKYVDY